MDTVDTALVQHVGQWVDPFSQMRLDDLGIRIRVTQETDHTTVQLCLPYPCQTQETRIQQGLQAHLCAYRPARYDIALCTDIPRANSSARIKNIIGISSAKGGVGKSTISAHIARCAADNGARVGLLDADLYGPSLPTLFGCTEHRAHLNSAQQFEAHQIEGLSLMSIGFLVNTQDAMIWRGPIATRTLLQLLQQTNWPELDYLFIDMPPGTGDIPLSLAQKAGLHGVLIVTTAQTLAVSDAKRGEQLWAKVNIPVMGIVDNMSYLHCDQCQGRTTLFGAMLDPTRFTAPILAHLPFLQAIATQTSTPQEMKQGCQRILAQLSVTLAQHL